MNESRRRNDTRKAEPPAPSNNGQPKPWRTEGLPKEEAGADGRRQRPRWWVVLIYLGLGYLLVFGMLSFQDSLGGPTKVPYTEFTAQVEQHNVAEVFSQGDTIEGTLREPRPVPDQDDPKKTYDRFTTERPTYAQDDLLTQLKAGGATVSATPLTQDRGIFWNLLIAFAPILLLFGFWFWLFRRAQAMGGGAGMFGMSTRKKKPVDPESVRVTFDDVAGIDEVKDEINEIVDYLRNPEKYRKLGAKVPKGVLLTGPPGTGKTLLARATAGEANVPFFSASGAEFIEMIVGVGASRVRELFEEARKVAPSIIFIDEIDTIGRSRSSAASVGGHDEREQTLNQILTEMDGFSGSEGVVVLAATNRPDILDPALLRPGRFDRRVAVNPPDRKGRVEILRVHTRSVPLADDVDLDRLAAATPGMTGADLANLVNEAALAAARDGQTEVTDRDLFEALEKVQLGTARSVVLPEEDRRRTAYHEAGHALLGMLQPGADPVRKVSIIPRGHALGVTLSTPDEDRYGYTAEYLRGRIIGALGGMAAEEEVYGVVTTGSESDLETATNLARGMVGRWGMSERIGPVSVLPKEGDPRMAGISDSMLGAVDQEVRRLIDGCYAEARELLRNNRDRLDSIVAELLVHETLDEDAVYAAAGISREAVVRA
ncbi:ATP-dependent zinc metalloprotease FtsH [Mycolicibacterium elephantis]|uniref:ATP-dependent zinc metalloprotease FtsH n=1 Tax=Mycolicibacterium elephantis TaxID=81858 RepID=A0A0M2ZFU7_9MYCO|nr:ATP-dependent zinc metalloprotease FtsH [Mycolicibacterium elephantis]KKW64019.1 cell division protein FtsH [Mycolicibacterium elephantis]ORA67868.1 cell division protein FtsH [Mycolicibacterium elephantis]